MICVTTRQNEIFSFLRLPCEARLSIFQLVISENHAGLSFNYKTRRIGFSLHIGLVDVFFEPGWVSRPTDRQLPVVALSLRLAHFVWNDSVLYKLRLSVGRWVLR